MTIPSTVAVNGHTYEVTSAQRAPWADRLVWVRGPVEYKRRLRACYNFSADRWVRMPQKGNGTGKRRDEIKEAMYRVLEVMGGADD